MQDKKVMEFETFSPEETLELGRKFGREAQPGEVYTLVGDLGVGKTVFTQGADLQPDIYHCPGI